MRVFAVCLLAAACAAPAGPVRFNAPAQLAAGAPVAAPDGLADYCLRVPGECSEALRTDLRGRIPATGAASFQTASFRTDRREDTVFHAMMAARLAPLQRASSSPSSSRMVLSDARWQELRQVNRAINRAIRPVTDRAFYGVEEYWQRPLIAFERGARGDCEDYALEKRARLLALGWAPDMLAMAVAVAPGVGLHATLVVQTDQGDFVLDNLHAEPRTLAELNYLWISRQVGPSLTNWAAADAIASPALRQAADVSAEAMFERLMRQHASAAASNVAPELGPYAPAQTLAPPQPLLATDETALRAQKPGRDPAPWKPSALAGGIYFREGMDHIAP